MELIGKKLKISYESGYEYVVDYISENELRWEGVGGPIRGYSNLEKCNIVKIREQIFFVSWLEKSGFSVSQLLDFENKTIVTYMTRCGKEEELRKGKIRILNN